MSLLNKRDLTLLVICICLLLLVAQSELLRNRETFTTRQPISKTGTLPWEGINIKESPDSLDKLPSTTLKDLTDPPAYQHSLFFEEDVDRIPESFVLVHAPGHTILKNVYHFNGTLYLVHNRSSKPLPPPHLMISAWSTLPGTPSSERSLSANTIVHAPEKTSIQIITPQQALTLFGRAARLVRGSTWMSMSPPAYTDPSVALQLLQTHHLYEQTKNTGEILAKKLLPPARVLFPHIPLTKSSELNTRYRQILNPLLSALRLLFPLVGFGFEDDWRDYTYSRRTFLFEYVTLVDNGAAARDPKFAAQRQIKPTKYWSLFRSSQQDRFDLAIKTKLALERWSPLQSVFSSDNLPDSWWPVWSDRLVENAGLGPRLWNGSGRRVVTYVSSQGSGNHWTLTPENHRQLVDVLQNLERRHEWEINIIDGESSSQSRLKLEVMTTILIGPRAPELMNVMWMEPSASATIFELFPSTPNVKEYATFKTKFVAEAVGINYVAWSGSSPISDLESDLNDSDFIRWRVKREPHNNSLQHPARALNVEEEPFSIDADALGRALVNILEANEGEDEEDM